MRVLFTELRATLIGFRNLLIGTANSRLEACKFLPGVQKSHNGRRHPDIGSRNTEIGVRFSHLSNGDSQQLFTGSEILTRRRLEGML